MKKKTKLKPGIGKGAYICGLCHEPYHGKHEIVVVDNKLEHWCPPCSSEVNDQYEGRTVVMACLLGGS